MKLRNLLFGVFTSAIIFSGCTKNSDPTPDNPGKEDVVPPIENETGDYPKGVSVVEFSDDLGSGKKCLGFIATIDFSKNEKLKFTSYYTLPKKTLTSIYKEYGNKTDKACLVINAGYFSGTTSIGLCISNGIVKTPGLRSMNWPNDQNYKQTVYPVRSALGQMEDGKSEIQKILCLPFRSRQR